MEIHAKVVMFNVPSFATGCVPVRTNLFDEVRKNPHAVCSRLMAIEAWELAEWVMDNFIKLPAGNA